MKTIGEVVSQSTAAQSSAETNRQVVLDVVAIRARVQGDEELLQEIVKLYLEDYPRMWSAVRDAVSRGDASALERAAHALKGSIANFETNATYNAALRLESLGRAGDLTGATEALKLLEEALERLRVALTDF